jgi:hypothetical protein
MEEKSTVTDRCASFAYFDDNSPDYLFLSPRERNAVLFLHMSVCSECRPFAGYVGTSVSTLPVSPCISLDVTTTEEMPHLHFLPLAVESVY